MSDKLKVLFKAPFSDHSGYATVARKLLVSLYKTDRFDLYLEPIVWINSGNVELLPDEKAIIDGLLQKKITPEDTTLIHFSIATEFFGNNSPYKKTVGFTMLETDKVAPYWAMKCNEMDSIIVPSTFCLSSFMQSNIIKPIRIVPFGIDFNKYTPEGEKLLDITTKFNFLSVGQWLANGDRKNITGIITTFLNQFRNTNIDDVGLILKTYATSAGTMDKTFVENQVVRIREQMGLLPDDGPRIYVVHGAMSEDNLIKLYRNADAFLLPTCGEAWGMPLMEAAAMELPIITTGGTGAETFLNPEYTILLNYEWKAIGNTLHWPGVYEAQQQLTIPNMEEFARMMHRIYKYKELALEQAEKQRQELIDRKFTWSNAATILGDIIEDINQ
jgi:hypothetical protein